MALANLSICYTWKNIKSEYNNNKFKITTINLKYMLQLGMINLICLMDHILFLMYKQLFTFVPNKQYGQLITITSHS